MKGSGALSLSVVAVSRNDDHGGDLHGRMQHFVSGFIAQCRRHQLAAELILVEWNPPRRRPALADVLEWPADFGPAQIRIVTVPPEVHAGFAHSAALPLFQMIGKNVGIRRARGRFVLATNVDILLDDEVVRYLRDRLQPGTVLRVDRYDVPSDLPKQAPFEEVLSDCSRRFFRVNTRFGIFDVGQRRFLGLGTSLEATIMSFIVGLRILGLPYRKLSGSWYRLFAGHALLAAEIAAAMAKSAGRALMRYARKVFPLRRLPFRAYHLVRRVVARGINQIGRVVRLSVSLAKQVCGSLGLLGSASVALVRYQRSRWLHTWACGDFTLLTRDDWFRLRGYPELPIFSWHVDSLFLYGAHANGIREVALDANYRIYHIDHSIGSGWSPEGGRQLFARLDAMGVPYLSNDDLAHWQTRFAEDPNAAVINDANWGLGDRVLPEKEILPVGRARAIGNDATVPLSPADQGASR